MQDWALRFDNFDDLAAALDKAGLAYGVVQDQLDVVRSPTAQHRGTRRHDRRQRRDRRSARCRADAVPILGRRRRASAAPRRIAANTTAAVLSEWLAMDAAEVDRLVAAGVLQTDEFA